MSTLRGKSKIILTGHDTTPDELSSVSHTSAELAQEALQEFMLAARKLIANSPPERNGARFVIDHPLSRIKCSIDVRWAFEDKTATPVQES